MAISSRPSGPASVRPGGSTKAAPLPHIPLEVNRQIALYLDRQSAFALTLTCKALRDAGETRLYQLIDLTSGYRDDLMFDEIGPATAHMADEEDVQPEAMTEDRLRQCQQTIVHRIRASDHALARYPYRRKCIKVLRVEPSGRALDINRSNARLLDIIFALFSQLERLDIVSLPSVSETPLSMIPASIRNRQTKQPGQPPWATFSGNANIVDHLGFYNGLCQPRGRAAQATFPRLEILRMCIPASVDRMVPFVLSSFVNAQAPLRELHLAATQHQWTSSGLTIRSAANMRDHATPHLPHLTHLTLFEPLWQNRGDLLLACLLKSAPNLTSLRIKEETVPIGSVANEHTARQQLKMLMCIPVDHTFDMSKVIGLEKHVENLVIQHTSLGETDEIVQLALPILPTARHLTVLTSFRPPLSQYAKAGVGPAPTYKRQPYPACSFPIFLLQSIEAMPHLEDIMLAYEEHPCPSIQQAEFIEPDFFVSSAQWEAGGQRGLVIRQYRHPVYAKMTFVHVRSLTRVVDAFTCPTYVSFQRFWCDYAAYCGERVDADLLRRVYEVAEFEKEWSTGGRDLDLPDKAWDMLQKAIQVDIAPMRLDDDEMGGATGVQNAVEGWIIKDGFGIDPVF